MKLEVDLKIVLLAIISIFFNRFELYIIFFFSIIIHEISHLLVGILVGLKPEKLKINPFGVAVEFYCYKNKKRLEKFITYLAGPIANLLICVIIYFIKIDESMKNKIFYTNLLLAIFNLIPILPLDGGKILKEIINLFTNIKNTNIIMNIISKIILSFITILYSIFILKIQNIFIFFVIIYLWYLQYIEEKKLNLFIKTYKSIEKVKTSVED